MIYTWIIEDKLAISPLPSLRDIDYLSKIFNKVVVLIEPHEVYLSNIDLYLNKWLEKGVEVYYVPTPDYHPVDLLELYSISKWIDENISKGSRVLVHCYGGLGRSGMVAAAYLIYKGWELYEAVKYIRSRRPGAIEEYSQHRVLEDYYILLKNIDRNIFDKHVEYIRRNIDKTTWKHISKTLQLSIELHDLLDVEIDLEKMIYAILYHCFDKDQLMKLINRNIITVDLINILEDNRLESILIKLAHVLDYHKYSTIVYIDSHEIGNKIMIELFCKVDMECDNIVEQANSYVKYLEKLLGKELDLKYYIYERYS